VLPAALRMRRSEEYARTIRTGARAGRDTLVVHCAVDAPHPDPHIGFVVSKGVGGAVVRNRVRRRLRGAVLEQQARIPEGVDVVVRALPPAADATYARLSEDLRSALGSALRKAGPGTTAPGGSA
jgi:ribonuclease P protein component